MINSLFMLGSSYNKNRKVSTIFLIIWLGYMFAKCDFSLGITFPIVNAITFLIVCILINVIKNKKVNTILSVFSIIIWSIIIDIISYFMYPMIVGEQNIFAYVFQGILFNTRYILVNIIALACVYGLDVVIEKISQKIKGIRTQET